MVKNVSCCCVLGSQLFSNPVTFVQGFEFIQVVNYAGKVCQMVSSVLCIMSQVELTKKRNDIDSETSL